MRVALVTTLTHGGPLELALVQARSLVDAGSAVRAICASEGLAARFAAAGAEPVVQPLRSGFDGRGALRLRRALAGAEVVHSHDRRAGLWTRALPRPSGAALVHTIHGLPDPYLPPPAGPGRPGLRARLAYRGLEGALGRRSALVTPTRAMAGELARRLGIPESRLTVIPNAVEPVRPAAGRGDAVGTLSVLEPVKGVDVFLDAAARLSAARGALRVVVFGSGSAEGALRAQASRLGLRAEFPGYVPAHEALGRLAVLALPSHMENAPIGLLQAMAAGVPVVASRVGGVPETAPAGTVMLVPSGDPVALAAALARLLDDPAAARAQAHAAREHVLAHATPARLAERTLALYEALRR